MKINYLRTNYWFNLKAGGSVSHTAGVINSLKNQCNLQVFANENLVEVDYPIDIIRPIKIPFLPNEINELLYSLKIISKRNKLNKVDFIYHRFNAFSFCAPFLRTKKCKLILEFNGSELWILLNWNKKGNHFLSTIAKWIISKFKLPIVYFVERYNLKKADYIVVVSEVMKQNLIQRNIDANKILVNPNGVDTSKFNPNISSKEIIAKYNLKDKIVLGFIGTFGQWHGVEYLAKAIVKYFHQFPERKENTRFLLIGNGKLYPQVKKIIQDNQLNEQVILTGLVAQNKAPEYLASCDILLSPHAKNPDGTAFFGSPTKLFEYMAMGKAIIASNLDQIGDILNHNKTALLIEPNNSQALSQAIDSLVQDKSLREKIGKNALNEVKKYYTWQEHTQKILNFVQK